MRISDARFWPRADVRPGESAVTMLMSALDPKRTWTGKSVKASTWWGGRLGVLLVGGEASGAFGLDAIVPPAARIGMVTYVSALVGAYVARERFWWPALTVLAVVWIAVASTLLAIVDAMGGMTAGEMLLYNLFGMVMSAMCVLAGVGSGTLLARRGQERSGMAASGR